MKKITFLFAAVLLLAGVVFVSCAQGANIADTLASEKVSPKCAFCGTEYSSVDKKNNCAVTEECPNFWYEKPVMLDGSSLSDNPSLLYFGVFPKTYVEINSDLTIDETKTVTMGSNTYYKGSDGKYYAEVNSDYYRVEPITWMVCKNDSETLFCRATQIMTASVFYNSWSNRTIVIDEATNEELVVSANNYKYSTIRAYLNGKYEENDSQTKTYVDSEGNGIGFLQTAFTSSAQSRIADTSVSIETKRFEDVYGQGDIDGDGKDDCTIEVLEIFGYTSDKIFILSKSDSGACGLCYPTDYAIAKGANVNSYNENSGSWWLRTPSMVMKGLSVYGINDQGAYSAFYCTGTSGVVPGLKINK